MSENRSPSLADILTAADLDPDPKTTTFQCGDIDRVMRAWRGPFSRTSSVSAAKPTTT